MLFVLTGPESTAKSTLAAALSEHFEAPLIEEAARSYLTRPHYEPSDLLSISALQAQAETPIGQSATAFADTDLQVIYIWWQERFGPVPLSLARAYAGQSARHYLLCEPDLPWAPDPLRENPHDRERLLRLYERDLQARGLPYDRVHGAGEVRLQCALAAVDEALRRARG